MKECYTMDCPPGKIEVLVIKKDSGIFNIVEYKVSNIGLTISETSDIVQILLQQYGKGFRIMKHLRYFKIGVFPSIVNIDITKVYQG